MEFRGDQVKNKLIDKTITNNYFNIQLKKKQRYMESILTESIESNIKLEEYPSKQIKLILQVVSNEGNLFSALYNAALVSLLHNGCKMRTTSFAYEFIPLDQNNIKLFPTKKEYNLDDDFDQACVVIDLNTQGVITLINQKAYNFKQIKDGIELITSQIQNTKDLLKSYLYQQYTKNL